jgi:hypothetical protein
MPQEIIDFLFIITITYISDNSLRLVRIGKYFREEVHIESDLR